MLQSDWAMITVLEDTTASLAGEDIWRRPSACRRREPDSLPAVQLCANGGDSDRVLTLLPCRRVAAAAAGVGAPYVGAELPWNMYMSILNPEPYMQPRRARWRHTWAPSSPGSCPAARTR